MPREEADLHWQVFYFTDDDYRLLRYIKKIQGHRVRADALAQLATIVEEIDLPVIKAGPKQIKLGLPKELYSALQRRAKETGFDQRALLVLAAREYRRRHRRGEKSRGEGKGQP